MPKIPKQKTERKPVLQHISEANPEPPNETPAERKRRLARIRAAVSRYYSSQAREQSTSQEQSSSQAQSSFQAQSSSQSVIAGPASRTRSKTASSSLPAALESIVSSSIASESEESLSVASESVALSSVAPEPFVFLPATTVSGPSSSRGYKSTTREAVKLRVQKHRKSKSKEQIEETRRKDRERKKRKYGEKKEEQYEQFHKIGYCDLDNYVEETVEGDYIEDGRHKFGRMDVSCEHCLALKWKEETRGFCYLNRQIQLIPLNPVLLNPALLILEQLLTQEDPDTNESYVN